ncbi:peptidoglycan-binding domain-containing protein [Mycolicibacter heraklionensis]|uniref:peptidoglycan-binding domain-containing protein n=1 Tax=Mycolicibacter heraklionensis TaxID=512402 RepID=UPI0007EBA8E2|nr:peptidoglycan-binding domain-containing protein [Mycolicibacter heraklionensis]OBG32438.1 hypothetical protein A5671_07870 [Mycolicibacter heraklionensis]
MNGPDGKWIGWGLGDTAPKVAEIQKFLAGKFASYAGHLVPTGTYDQATADVVAEMQRRYGLPVTGIFDWASQVKSGFYRPAPKNLPLFFTVEGHLSDMWRGPVADTATILEQEGHCIHRPTGYNNGAIPFDNLSGENELARRIGQTVQDDGVQFPPGTKWMLGDFSQGSIIATDFEINHLLPGCDLACRAPDYLGRLSYGNPTRSAGSVAPWSRGQAGPATNFGLDPLVRFDKLGINLSRPQMDVYRKGDIFADNEPTVEGKIKAAIYQAVARGDLFSDPFSICAQIAAAFTVPVDYVIGAFQAIVSGIGFLETGDRNPHYSPYDITGGLNWARDLLTASKAA